MEKFTDRVWQEVGGIWESYLDHPFVKGLGDDSLEVEKFQHWLKQDYLYLIDYARLFAIGTSKAPTLERMQDSTDLLHGVLHTEMGLHRSYAASYGIEESEILTTPAAATTTAYTSYMLNVSQAGGVENVIAAILTCVWSYHFIGQRLSEDYADVDHNNYGSWIDMYTSEEFAGLVEKTKKIINDLCADKSERELDELIEIIVKTSRFEYMFWDMCWEQSHWPSEDVEG